MPPSGRSIVRILRVFCRFLGLLASITLKRLVIFLFCTVAGFAGPIISVETLPGASIFSFAGLDLYADFLQHHHEFPEVILGCIPIACVCLTDFLSYVLNDEYVYSRARLAHTVLFAFALGLVFCSTMLLASYVQFDRPGVPPGYFSRSFFAQFEWAWLIVKAVIIGALIFETSLAFLEVHAHLLGSRGDDSVEAA